MKLVLNIMVGITWVVFEVIPYVLRFVFEGIKK